ncbi:MAG: endonuclease/exonuclease/phosphatase family protein [Candidatus Cyclobacteriaceae bacterium M3_2C_046]
MPWVKIFSLLFGVFMIVATLLPFLKKEYWWIRMFEFPRMQILIIGLIALGLYTMSWDKEAYDLLFVGPLVIAISYQTFTMLPYSPIYNKQVVTCKDPVTSSSFSIMVMNVLMSNRNIQGALKNLEKANPDIFLALETDHWWKDQLVHLEKDYPYTVLVPIDNTYGMLLFSKLKLIDPEVKYLLKPNIPSIHTRIKLYSGDVIRFYGVHPEPPAPGHSEKSTPRDAELITVGKETRNTNEPTIVAGDLNDVAWSYTTNLFQRFSELLDPRIGRGMYNTFNAKNILLRWPLDHIFHSDHFQLLDIHRLDFFDSDHFPMYIKLCFKPSQTHIQQEPKADGEDEDWAIDKVDRAND